MTGADLNYKPSTAEQAKFDYSPLSKFFNRGLKEEDKKEGLLKRLKNIEDKSEEQLKAIKSKNKTIKEVTDFIEEPPSLEANGTARNMRICLGEPDSAKICYVKLCGYGNEMKKYLSA